MEDVLIVAVCGQSVLYDTTLVSYRDRIKKEQAWVVVGEETGIPVDVRRRKWKSLRDRYMREKRREKEGKKSGSAARTVKKWKFFAVLYFLDPFVHTEGDQQQPSSVSRDRDQLYQTLTMFLLLLLSLPLPQDHRAG
ncbi:unnamed protein product [Arctogadus glacialis]